MDTTFMNSENSKTSDPYRLLLNLTYKINLKRSDKRLLLFKSQHILMHGKKKSHIRTIKFKISAPILNPEFELHDG